MSRVSECTELLIRVLEMTTTYPSQKQTFTDPSGNSALSTGPSHSQLHTDINDTVESIQDTVGTTAGTNVLKDFTAGQFPVRINSSGVVQHTIAGTLTDTVINGTLSGTAIDTDTTLAANSDIRVPSQKAIKTYVDTHSSGVATDPIWDAAGDLAVGSGANTAVRLALGALGAHLFSNGTTAVWESSFIKAKYFSRDLSASSGDVSYTGIGWKPKTLLIIGNVVNLANRNSIGFYDGSGYAGLMFFTSTATSATTTEVIYFGDGATWSHTAVVKTLDDDGFTLTYTKTGSATGTANIICFAFR